MKRPSPFKELRAKSAWGGGNSPIWVASSFSLCRNLSAHNFPVKMSHHESEITLALLKEGLMKVKEFDVPRFYEISKVKPWEKEFLLERFFITYDRNNAECRSGMVIDQSGTFFGIINGLEHLTLYSIDNRSDWNRAWGKLSKIEVELSNYYSFAYSPKFGYLTSKLVDAGTTLRVRAFLHLPSLIHLDQMDALSCKELKEDVVASGLMGDDYGGDFVVIQNRCTLGLTEDHILERVHGSATRLMALEKVLRQDLMESPNALLVDKVSRAIGLLKHSHHIEMEEALSALSFIKLGIDLKWISGLSDEEVNMAFFEVRRAHLELLHDGEVSSDQISYTRAQFLKRVLRQIAINL